MEGGNENRGDYNDGLRSFQMQANPGAQAMRVTRLIHRGAIFLLPALGALGDGTAVSLLVAGQPSAYESMALGRLQEIHAMGEAFKRSSWNGFDPSAISAVILDPDGGAMAVGFTDPPAGFKMMKLVEKSDQLVFRAAPGVFNHPGVSPAKVSGEWAVVSRIDPPASGPDGRFLGRRSAEEWIADFVGDAFLAYLAGLRKEGRTFAIGAAAYPDNADLMALTTLENRMLLQAIVMSFDETNFEEFARLTRHVIAVRRARWNLMGPELASIEQAIENWDGLSLYVAAHVYRSTLSKTFSPAPISHLDPTYAGLEATSMMFRLMLTNYPLTFTPDAPNATRAQVAYRGGSLGFLLDRVSRQWHEMAETGDRSLIEMLAEQIELKAGQSGLKAEEEAAGLEAAKRRNFYYAALRLAREDLKRNVKQREETLAREFPPGPLRLEIHLTGDRLTVYQEDPATTSDLGGGMVIHRGRLEIHGPGVDLTFDASRDPSSLRLLTRAKARRDELTGITLILPEEASLAVAAEPYRPEKRPLRLSAGAPLHVKAKGFVLQLQAGALRAAGGGLEVEAPPAPAAP